MIAKLYSFVKKVAFLYVDVCGYFLVARRTIPARCDISKSSNSVTGFPPSFVDPHPGVRIPGVAAFGVDGVPKSLEPRPIFQVGEVILLADAAALAPANTAVTNPTLSLPDPGDGQP